MFLFLFYFKRKIMASKTLSMAALSWSDLLYMTQFKNSNFLKSMKETFLKIAYLFIATPILAQFKRQSQYLYRF